MTFDASAFMDQTVESSMSTRMTPIPDGEYMARVGSGEDDVKIESIQGKKDPTKTYVRLTLQWDIIDENLKATLNRETVRIRDQFLLDVDPVTNMLSVEEGRNISLGQRREALGLNDGPFNLSMFRGAGPAMIRTKQRPGDEPGVVYNEVARVVKLG